MPRGIPAVKMVVWRGQWPLKEPWIVPRLARCLRQLVHQDSEMLQENAWNAIKNAATSGKRTSVHEVMKTAHVATVGAVNSLDEANPYLSALLPQFRKVKDLTFAVDGETLLFWNSDTVGAYSRDIPRVSWEQVKERLEKGLPLQSMTHFYLLLGGM